MSKVKHWSTQRIERLLGKEVMGIAGEVAQLSASVSLLQQLYQVPSALGKTTNLKLNGILSFLQLSNCKRKHGQDRVVEWNDSDPT